MIEKEIGNCTNETLSKVPTESQINGLTIEVYVLIVIYMFTITFTMYNIYAYLWKQRRYQTWLVTFFYILAMIVLTTRVT